MKDTNYVLGLDLGISSVGWAVVELKEDENKFSPFRLLKAGVRVFPAAETPKTGESLNKICREKRSARRTLRRKRRRISQIKSCFVDVGMIPRKEDFESNRSVSYTHLTLPTKRIV